IGRRAREVAVGPGGARAALDAVRDVEFQGTSMRVLATGLDGLVGTLAERLGAQLRDLAVQDANLESVFINLTGRDLRE
ncbi:MAG: hypothetical protein JJT89_17330, partial [Nitriliruptoraceae bacterium]|nr:hypothetical protein [Nitriliruptoraceae bacterium]